VPDDVNVGSPRGARLRAASAPRGGWFWRQAGTHVTLLRDTFSRRNSAFRVWLAVAIREAGA